MAFDWRDFSANALGDLSYGLGHSTNIGDAFGVAADHGAQLQQQRAAAAKQAQETNQSLKVLQEKFPDLADYVNTTGDVKGAMTEMLQRLSPDAALDRRYKEAQIGELNAKASSDGAPGGTFDGTSMDGQSWNILLKAEANPALKNTPEYQTALAIVSQPKPTMVQTPDGMVQVMQAPQLPGFLTKGQQGGPQPAQAAPGPAIPAGVAPQSLGAPDAGLSPAIGGIPGVSVSAPIPGTQPKPTEAQQRMGLLSNSLDTAAAAVLDNWDSLSSTKEQVIGLGGALTKPWQSDGYQQGVLGLQSAISDIVPAISGAAFSNAETQEKVKAFTPRPFDKPGTLKLKKQLFLSYVQGIASASSDPKAKATAQAFLDKVNKPSAATVIDGVTIEPM